MANFESSVKVIPYSQERVYAKLSDLSNLESVKGRLPEDKIQDLSFDSDTLSFSVSPIGQLTLQIVEREPCKCIKLATTNSPLPFNMWNSASLNSRGRVQVESDYQYGYQSVYESEWYRNLFRMVWRRWLRCCR